MSDRERLLALVRQVRRQQLARAALAGAGFGAGLAGGAVAVTMAVAAVVGHDVQGQSAALVLASLSATVGGALVGGGVRGLQARRRRTLWTCARDLDRAWVNLAGATTSPPPPADARPSDARSSDSGDDAIAIAVALAERPDVRAGGELPPSSPFFVDAIFGLAWSRASATVASRSSPAAFVRPLAAAVVGVALAGLSAALPWSKLSGMVGAASDNSAVPSQRNAGANPYANRATIPALSVEDADTEAEAIRRIEVDADRHGDQALLALARSLAQTLRALAGQQLTASDASVALASLAQLAAEAADESARASAALEAARANAERLGKGGRDLADAIARAARPALGDADLKGAVVAAAGHAAGRAALAATAGAAARALATADANGSSSPTAAGGAGSSSAGGTPNPASAGNAETESPRRLEREGLEREAAEGSATAAAPSGQNRPERRLERLRRDLNDAQAACAQNPAACARAAGSAGRSLEELARDARTAEARRRLQQTIDDLLDRVRRSGGGGDGHRTARERFARAARGAAPQGGESTRASGATTKPADAPGTLAPPGAHGAVGARGAGHGQHDAVQEAMRARAVGTASGGGSSKSVAAGDAVSGPEEGAGPPAETESASNEAAAGSSAPGAGEGSVPMQGAAMAAPGSAGIGDATAGKTLGGASPSRGQAGHDLPTHVESGPGPSRAQVIAGAGERGFAAAPYRRVYEDYRAAEEDALESTVVPPGRRHVVRRYFQLIRPRTP